MYFGVTRQFSKNYVLLKKPQKVEGLCFFSEVIKKKLSNQKSENITLSLFSKCCTWCFPIFDDLQFFNHFWKKTQGIVFPTFSKLSLWVSLTIQENWSWQNVHHFFFMKTTAWTIRTPRTIPKLVTTNISRWKERLSKKNGFP